MLPMYKNGKTGLSFKNRVRNIFNTIFADKNSRNLFMFLTLNFSFAFVELAYGMWTNSLGLISDSFHMFFDCSALIAGLAASIIARWKPNERFTYGYQRAEIIAGFVNGLFLLFVAFFIFSEAVERMAEPPEVKHDRLFVISVLGFLVNVVGIVVFHHGGAHSHCSHDHSHSHSQPHSHSHSHSNCSHSHGHGNASKRSDFASGNANALLKGQYNATALLSGPLPTVLPVGPGVAPGAVSSDSSLLIPNGNGAEAHSHCDGHGHSHCDGHGHSHSHGHGHNHSHGHGHSHNHANDFEDHHHHANEGDSVGGSTPTGSQRQIIQGVFLHILADTLGSVGVMLSSYLIHAFGWMIADPICSLFISVMIGISTYPLLRDSIGVLLQRTPRELELEIAVVTRRVEQLPGVRGVREAHFWTLCSDVHYGTLCIDVPSKLAIPDFNSPTPVPPTESLKRQVTSMYHSVGVKRLTVQFDLVD